MLYTQIVCFSQNYFITLSKDSTACKQINFFDTNAQGKMIDFEYVNNENETIRLKKNDIPEIQKLCQDGVVYLRMPLNINKPDGYYRFGRRMVQGKITVDVFDDVSTSYRLKENFELDNQNTYDKSSITISSPINFFSIAGLTWLRHPSCTSKSIE